MFGRAVGVAAHDVAHGGAGCLATVVVVGAAGLTARIWHEAGMSGPVPTGVWAGLGIGAGVVLTWCLRRKDRRIPFRAGVMAALGCSREAAEALAVKLRMDPDQEYPRSFFVWLRDRR